MPGRNGMGPEGLGPNTGRGFGPCKSDNVSQMENVGNSSETFNGWGMGAQYRGRGVRHNGFGNGYGRGAFKGLGCYNRARWGQYNRGNDSEEQEVYEGDLKQLLEQQKEMLQLMKEFLHKAD